MQQLFTSCHCPVCDSVELRVARAIYDTGNTMLPAVWHDIPWNELEQEEKDVIVHLAKAAIKAMKQP